MTALRRSSWRRRLYAVISLWLALVLSGQGHTLQALGVPLACEHLLSGHDAPPEAEQTGPEHSRDRDCPPSCADCACGQMPMQAASVAPALPSVLLEPLLLDLLSPPTLHGLAPPLRIERPPRAHHA